MTREHVHDSITHAKERVRRERLSEEVGKIVHGDRDLHVFDTLTDEEVTSLDVLHTLVVLRVPRSTRELDHSARAGWA